METLSALRRDQTYRGCLTALLMFDPFRLTLKTLENRSNKMLGQRKAKINLKKACQILDAIIGGQRDRVSNASMASNFQKHVEVALASLRETPAGHRDHNIFKQLLGALNEYVSSRFSPAEDHLVTLLEVLTQRPWDANAHQKKAEKIISDGSGVSSIVFNFRLERLPDTSDAMILENITTSDIVKLCQDYGSASLIHGRYLKIGKAAFQVCDRSHQGASGKLTDLIESADCFHAHLADLKKHRPGSDWDSSKLQQLCAKFLELYNPVSSASQLYAEKTSAIKDRFVFISHLRLPAFTC